MNHVPNNVRSLLRRIYHFGATMIHRGRPRPEGCPEGQEGFIDVDYMNRLIGVGPRTVALAQQLNLMVINGSCAILTPEGEAIGKRAYNISVGKRP